MEHLRRGSQHRCSRRQLLVSLVLGNAFGDRGETSDIVTKETEQALDRAVALLASQGRMVRSETETDGVIYQLTDSMYLPSTQEPPPLPKPDMDLASLLDRGPLLYSMFALHEQERCLGADITRVTSSPLLPTRLPAPDPLMGSSSPDPLMGSSSPDPLMGSSSGARSPSLVTATANRNTRSEGV